MTHPFGGDLSAQRRQLGAALRRLRNLAGMSAEQVGELTTMSQSKVSRIELGDYKTPIPVSIVEKWAKATGASEDDLDAVLNLADRAVTTSASWAAAGDLAKQQEKTREALASAKTILSYQTAGVPGLLQTEDVAWRTFAAGYPPPDPANIAGGVMGRLLARNTILPDESKRFEFIFTEPSLREWRSEPDIMRPQLDRLIADAGRPNVTLCVLSRAPGWADHGFAILADRGHDGPLVHVELLTQARNYEDPEVVATYQDAFAALKAASVTGEEAIALVGEIRRSLGPGAAG